MVQVVGQVVIEMVIQVVEVAVQLVDDDRSSLYLDTLLETAEVYKIRVARGSITYLYAIIVVYSFKMLWESFFLIYTKNFKYVSLVTWLIII